LAIEVRPTSWAPSRPWLSGRASTRARRADPAAPVDAGVRQHAFDGERLAFQMGERLGTENVAAITAVCRASCASRGAALKNGEIRVLIATASLELGIGHRDGGSGLPDSVAAGDFCRMQRVGRAGHWRGATPKGRFFALTRDDLMEQAALIRAMRAGVLDRLEIPTSLRCADAADRGDLRREPWESGRSLGSSAARSRIATCSGSSSMRRFVC